MSNWVNCFNVLEVGTLVPDEFDRYRPAVVDALAFFLENLSPDRAIEIFAEQAAMPTDAGIDERLVAVARRCPALHKLGQVLARDRRLPLGFRRLLQSLESMKPTQPPARVQAELEQELGSLSKIGIDLDGEPLAEASVAVVVPFVWRDGRRDRQRRGVFKLLKSGIEQKLDEDLRLLQRLGALLDDRCDEYNIPPIEYESTFAEVRELLAFEVRLDQEQEHLAAARAVYENMTSVVVPELYPFSTPRVTAMERIDGRKVTSGGDAMSPLARQDLAAVITEALIAHPIWSAGPSTMFHADPHAGNLLVTDDRQLAILDWSLVGHLTKQNQICLSRILLGAMTLDGGRIEQAIRDLAEGDVESGPLRRVVDDGLQRLRRDVWPGLEWLTDLMDTAATTARVRFGPNLIVFRKVLQTLEGVIADVSEECHVDTVLISSFLVKFGFEWGFRPITPLFSREFATRLSNADLARLCLSAPLMASRSWWALQQRLLSPRNPRLAC